MRTAPSVLWRLEKLALAADLANHLVECSILQPHQVQNTASFLAASCASSCEDTFSYQRLEFLGDAALKVVCLQHLFIKYPDKHQGQLTTEKGRLVSNRRLLDVARTQKLERYLHTSRFYDEVIHF